MFINMIISKFPINTYHIPVIGLKYNNLTGLHRKDHDLSDHHRLKKLLFLILLLTFLVSMICGCQMPANLTPEPPSVPTIYAELLKTMTPEDTSAQDGTPGSTPISSSPTPPVLSPTLPPALVNHTVWVDPGLPKSFMASLQLPDGVILSDDAASAGAHIRLTNHQGPMNPEDRVWVYALVAPFYTLHDDLSFEALKGMWQNGSGDGTFQNILVSEETRFAMVQVLGAPSEAFVRTLTEAEINAVAISDQPVLAILPFETLEPAWKVVSVDQSSPITNEFDPLTDPLALKISLEMTGEMAPFVLPPSNYDPTLRTALVMTGVTALVRATAYQMEVQGINFPAQDIQTWLSQADITHISNEVPFARDCPYPDPNQQTLIFCSDPDYIELLETVDTDVIELSGNHLMDWGEEAARLTLELYAARGWATYAGGINLEEAQSPAYISHNGHHFAFIGCNPAGPVGAWATETQPGTAPCGNYDWLVAKINRLRDEGYIPIVTFQYIEDYTPYPSTQMMADFRRMIDAGAVVVNGSQAHTPKWMEFYQNGFIHYGLGNLFFDQMEVYYNNVYLPGTRDEFIDRLIFYDGRLISVDLLTALLEDYARPRPMTTEERHAFLTRIFTEALQTINKGE
jgi:poly-gamma-glutamate synthesis protein (capsule biosynthesis protein)